MPSPTQIETGDYICNKKLRADIVELIEKQVTSYRTIAESLEWMRDSNGKIVGDATRVKKVLGVQRPSHRDTSSDYIQRDMALQIIRVLGLYPMDYDL